MIVLAVPVEYPDSSLTLLSAPAGWSDTEKRYVPIPVVVVPNPTIFALEVGKLSPEIPNYDNDQQIYIFMVSEKQSDKELEPEDFEIIKNNALQDFLNEERKNHDIYAVLDNKIYQWIIDELNLTKKVTPTPDP